MHKITVMGTSDKLLTNIKKEVSTDIILRTKTSKAAQMLDEAGVPYATLDEVYERAENFDSLDLMLAQKVIQAADNKDILYIVPGSAVTGDGSVKEIARQHDNVLIECGDAPEYQMLAALLNEADASNGYSVIPAACIEKGSFSPRIPLIITALDNELLLSDIKLLLGEEYGDSHEVFIGSNGTYSKMELYEIDRVGAVDHTTMMFVPPKTNISRYDSYDLEMTFKTLRAPGGCPWDREQTHETLKRYLLEECAETLDAIDKGDMFELMDELGDVLLQVMFHSAIAGERGDFDIRDVTDNLVRKLIRRHPHVFAEANAQTPDEVLKQWDEIKHEEKEDKSQHAKLVSVPKSMTALMRAQKVLSRAKKAQFLDADESDAERVYEKIGEGIRALGKALADKNTEAIEEMIGQILFDISNLSRIMDIESELALKDKTGEFIDKCGRMEKY